MRSEVIRILIVAVTVAVVALIGMQFYWVKNAVELKRNEFDRKVGEALTLVSTILEKKETLKNLRMQQQSQYVFIDDDAEEKLYEKGLDTSYNYLLVREYERKGDGIQMSVTEEKDGKTITHKEQFIRPGEAGLLEDQSDEFSINRMMPKEHVIADGITLTEGLSSEKIKRKKAFVGDIMKSLMEVDLQTPLEKRINKKELDSLIALALAEKGIYADYEFGVYDRSGKLVIAKYDSTSDRLEGSSYRARLFRNDLLGNPGFLKMYFPGQTSYLLKTNSLMLATSLIIVLAIIYIFFWTVKAIITQKRNSEIKNDFINNMTHELKTPISTISLACEVLRDGSLNLDSAATKRYVRMIDEENKRLGLLVQEVLQSAVLDKGDFKLKKEPLNLSDLVREVTSKMQIKVREKGGIMNVFLPENENCTFEGDKVHLSNVLYNLIDNAIKYTPENPEIEISLEKLENEYKISVKDNGIGISREHQKKVFDRLYRVPTGNLHDVKGFGLGLNYVVTILKRINGRITLISKPGTGSTFTIYLPLENKT